MSEQIIQRFNQRVDQGALTDDVKVTYRISGGMPYEAVEQEFMVSGSGSANLAGRGIQGALAPQAFAINQGESQEIFRLVSSGIDRLPTRSEARFLPDSLIGTITVEVNGEEETFYFLVDEADRAVQNKPIPQEISEALQRLTDISQRTQE
jgi:hypothetical protein